LIIAVNRADFGSTNDELSEAWLGMIRGFQEASKAALGCRKRLGKSPFYLIIWGKAWFKRPLNLLEKWRRRSGLN